MQLVNNDIQISGFLSRVYLWMFVGLLLTATAAFITVSTPAILNFIFGNMFVFFGLVILELALVFILAGMVEKMSEPIAMLVFLFYSVLNGVTLSLILLIYTFESIAFVFIVTSAMFAIMSIYGYFTKRDLTTIGNLLFMGLIGIIVASIINIFLGSSTMGWIISVLGVVIFTGLIAYDTQKIKKIAAHYGTDQKWAIRAALSLYLDFVNLFIMLLRLFGDRK